MPKYLVFLCLAATCLPGATDPSAEALARAAEKARNSGQVVRAYLLYAEAAARAPLNDKYRLNRDGLKPLAQMMSKAGVEKEPAHDELLASASQEPEEPLEPIGPVERAEIEKLQPPPKLVLESGTHDFHANADERRLFETVAGAYGVKVMFDPQFDAHPNVRIDMDGVDGAGALKGVAEATNSFLFPISPNTVFIARDTPQKREQYEPQIAVTIPLPDVTDPKQVTEVANAARQAFNLRHIGMDSSGRAIVIRDKISRARPAQSLLESLIRPPAQLGIEVEILAFDSQRTLHYGTSLPNTVPLLNFGQGFFQRLYSIPAGYVNFLTFGGGATLFGIGITDASVFASLSKSQTKTIYDATVVVSSGETAQLHVGDKFPIATSLYTGASQVAANTAFYTTPAPQIQMEDLGIMIKVKPELHADGDVRMTIHAEYQALGTQTFNTVPSILTRQFEGNILVRQGEWAILSGLDTQTSSVTKTGIAGLSQIPAIGDLFSDVTKTQVNSNTLMVIKPHALWDRPLVDAAPVFVGAESGRKVLL